MPSDRERLSFDERQKYRSVVAQQGRVTLPADFNETQEISLQEQRAEALDFVGPVGTPDDGYAITIPSASTDGDFSISAGTMYVGGIRTSLQEPARYFAQPDWLDPTDVNSGREFIVLRLEEREISAVEDSVLREVALGGPDTSQRTRMLQRIMRLPIKGTDCAGALAEQIKNWDADGWVFHPETAQLQSVARLQVGFDDSGPPPGPCEPAASGGYAGAENQLIRVRISSQGKFVWGYDNASFLYRVDVVDSQTVKLQSVPVDQYHFPRKDQAVELLRSELSLANGELVAYGEGLVMTLGEAYNKDAQTVHLPQVIPAPYTPPATPRLFLRVWEEELNYTPGVPVKLGTTGLTVTIAAPADIHTGDFWAFAARPSTPVQLYQDRYRIAPQPPEGPRLWVCPLAVVEWTVPARGGFGTGTVLSDCREHFDNLVELTKRKAGGGCCTITLSPADLDGKSLNAIIASLPENVPVKICLSPGNYSLKEPIVIRRNNVTIEACPAGAVLFGRSILAFNTGMLIVQQAATVALRGLTFRPAETAFEKTTPLGVDMDEFMGKVRAPNANVIGLMLGIRLVQCEDVSIEECRFVMPPIGERSSTFAAAIYGTGSVSGLTLHNNQFERILKREDKTGPIEISDKNFRIFIGYLHVPSAIVKFGDSTAGISVTGLLMPAKLTNARITLNRFTGFSAALLVQAALGAVRIGNNDVENCYSGFWLLTPRTLGFTDLVFKKDHKDLGASLNFPVFLADPILAFASSFGRILKPVKLDGIEFKEVTFVPPSPNALPPDVPQTELALSFFSMWTLMGLIEQSGFTVFEERAELHVTHNRIQAVLQKMVNGAFSGPALVMWGEDITERGSAPVETTAIGDDNDARAKSRNYTGVVMLFGFTTITGNVVFAGRERPGLLVFPATPIAKTPPVAITGNMILGSLAAPPRPLAIPLDTWNALNTVDF